VVAICDHLRNLNIENVAGFSSKKSFFISLLLQEKMSR
jgi:hypothetical protein